MIKALKILLTVLITSFYYFPFYSTFLPTITKNILAALGIVFIIIEMIRKKDASVPRELFILLFLSGMVSLISLVSITYNQTPDSGYATFIRSTIIWLSGAFMVCFLIRSVHGRIDVPLVAHYLIGACLFQCVSAILIEFIPAFRAFVDRYVIQGQSVLQEMGRLYGIGASLDVAGSRFAAVLAAIAFLLVSSPENDSIGKTLFYTFSFVVITVIGNMIARTTTVGALIGLAWMIISPFILPRKDQENRRSGKGIAILIMLGVLIGVSFVLYNAFPDVQRLFRFGFEGFFAWVETGEWKTSSTNMLETMVVWPDDLKTWIIGDGYFENSRYDPNYLGSATTFGYYMGTDIGYLRFLFYFGIAGLVWIIAFIAYSAYICANYFTRYAWLFVLTLAVSLTVWTKVATDLFLFFCMFLCAAALNESSEDSPESTNAEFEPLETT